MTPLDRTRNVLRKTLLLMALVPVLAGAQIHPAPTIFARVGDETISLADFEATMANAARQKFFHLKVPEGAMPKLQREVAQEMIDRLLLLAEARRREIKPDPAFVEQKVAPIEARNANNPAWLQDRDAVRPGMIRYFEEQSLLEQIEKQVKAPGEPDEAGLRAYYQANQDKFTEPEQFRVSIILLRVDPGSPTATWNATLEEGQLLAKSLRAGADFAEAVKLKSADVESVDKGGSMGWLHKGQLPEMVQEVIDKLSPGEISNPLPVLEGILIARLDERRSTKQHSLESVKPRATALWKRDAAADLWTRFVADLRKKTPVSIDESRLLPLPVESEKK